MTNEFWKPDKEISFDDKWASIKSFISQWHKPLSEKDGLSIAEIEQVEARLGFKLPILLREWYKLAGKRKDLITAQNYLLLLNNLTVVGDILVFYMENQSVVAWGVRLDDINQFDPPVLINANYLYEEANNWTEENASLLSFIFQMLVHETIISAPNMINGPANQAVLERLKNNFSLLDFPEWHWPVYPTNFFASQDVLIAVNGEEWVWIAAKNQNILLQIKALLDIK